MLDSHGLRHAIDNGPLREMLEDGNIVFDPRFTGPVDQLDDDARTAAYRICQAAVREAVRLDIVSRFALGLEVSAGEDGDQAVAMARRLSPTLFP